ncbi:MAG TPA: hypothetical protein VH044_08060 [Polyangiaceae bacterium]|jgi:hypothetical protein|nr:hypothetical protein [Polyangiaceae bacterium]
MQTPVRMAQWRLAAIAGAAAMLGVLVAGLAIRGCREGRRPDLEQRVARIEDLLGLVDAGPFAPPGDAAPAPPVSADDRAGSCAVARVAAYRAWQEAIARAKVSAGPAQAACADEWSDKRKQACFYAATATVRTAQAARDALMAGGAGARDAVKGVKDDPKNEALARARAAADAVFAGCDDDGG